MSQTTLCNNYIRLPSLLTDKTPPIYLLMIEGIHGAGKTTLFNHLQNTYKNCENFDFYFVDERVIDNAPEDIPIGGHQWQLGWGSRWYSDIFSLVNKIRWSPTHNNKIPIIVSDRSISSIFAYTREPEAYFDEYIKELPPSKVFSLYTLLGIVPIAINVQAPSIEEHLRRLQTRSDQAHVILTETDHDWIETVNRRYVPIYEDLEEKYCEISAALGVYVNKPVRHYSSTDDQDARDLWLNRFFNDLYSAHPYAVATLPPKRDNDEYE